jgi:hypothetical protein
MSTKTPTITGVKAKLKKAAAAAGLHLELTHRVKGYECGVKVDAGYTQEARRAGLLHISDSEFTGSLMDWVRSVLTYEELTTVCVLVEINNSEIQVDYFSTCWVQVQPDWTAYVEDGRISGRWADELLGGEWDGMTYDRGTHSFTCSEITSLCPSDAHALALAVCMDEGTRGPNWNADTVERLAALDAAGLALFRAMLTDWASTMDELLDAVEVLVPQEAPALAPVELAPVLVEPAQVEPVRVEPAALVEYLGRLLHVPKKDYAVRVWVAVRDGVPVPEHSADWAGDVVRKVRRYANA